MSESPELEEWINGLLDDVESLLQRVETLEQERDKWKKRAESIKIDLREARKEQERLREKMDDQHQRFQSLLENLRGTFKRIKKKTDRFKTTGDGP